jgi:MFS family permease
VPPRLVLAALLVAGALVSGITALHGVQPNDEGLMLQAVERIAGGQVPYGDFWWFYPPGQPYALAGLRELFGPSLLTWRIVRVLADAAVAVLAYALARRAAGPRVSLVAWAMAILAMAYPSGPHPFPIALALALGALLAFEERPALAGVLVGAAAAWRIEFAVFATAGILLARAGGAGRFALAALGTAALLYAPVVIAAGIGPSWDLLVDYPLTDFRDYQTLPFPLSYDGPLNTGSLGGFFTDSLEPLALFYLPLALVVGLAGAAVAVARPLSPRVIATGVFALGALAYLLVRTDLFHTAPLAVLVAILGAWALAPDPRTVLRGVPAALAGLALVYAAAEGLDRRALVLREDTVALDLPVADGVRVPPRQAAELEGVVARLGGRGPIYVATRRADLVTSGHPLLYVLAGRPNPTRYDIPAPGVVTSAPVQREIVRDLERTRSPLVVRWTDPITAAAEPNAAGRSSGVRLLDDYLARSYRPAGRVGSFRLLERRAP